MSYYTRNMLSYGISRNAGEMITYEVDIETANNDGSFTTNPITTTVLARVVDLQENELQKLQAGGISIKSGVSVSIVGELAKAPYKITRANGIILNVYPKFTISENVSIFICSEFPLGSA